MAQERGRRPDPEKTDRRDDEVVGRMPLIEEDGDEFEELDDVEDDVEEREGR
jgi:hypothetical protein